MTVDELVQLLASHPPHLRVVVDGFEGGYDHLSPRQLRVVKTAPNTGTRDYVRNHGDADYLPKDKLAGLQVEEALALHRTSH